MFKVNNKITRTTRHWRFSGVSVVNFEHISHHFSSVSIVDFEQVYIIFWLWKSEAKAGVQWTLCVDLTVMNESKCVLNTGYK